MSDRNCTKDRPGDLWGQLEGLLHVVWTCERQWRLDDRLDLMLGNRLGSAR